MQRQQLPPITVCGLCGQVSRGVRSSWCPRWVFDAWHRVTGWAVFCPLYEIIPEAILSSCSALRGQFETEAFEFVILSTFLQTNEYSGFYKLSRGGNGTFIMHGEACPSYAQGVCCQAVIDLFVFLAQCEPNVFGIGETATFSWSLQCCSRCLQNVRRLKQSCVKFCDEFFSA